jgi:hypothetical protein
LAHRTSGSHGSIPQHGVFGMGDINTAGKEEYRQHIRENASTDDMHDENDGYSAEPESENMAVPEEPLVVDYGIPLTPVPASPAPAPVVSPDATALLLPPPAMSPKAHSESASSPRSLGGVSPRSPIFAGQTSGSSRASSPVPDTPPASSGFWKRLAKSGSGTGKVSKRERMAEAVSGLLERTTSRGTGLGGLGKLLAKK